MLKDKNRLINELEMLYTLSEEESQQISGGSTIDLKPNTDFPGNDLHQKWNVSLEDCRRACVSNPKCPGFSFVDKKGSCWLKYDLSAPTHMPGVTSGIKV